MLISPSIAGDFHNPETPGTNYKQNPTPTRLQTSFFHALPRKKKHHNYEKGAETPQLDTNRIVDDSCQRSNRCSNGLTNSPGHQLIWIHRTTHVRFCINHMLIIIIIIIIIIIAAQAYAHRLTYDQPAICSPGLPFNGLHPRNPCNYSKFSDNDSRPFCFAVPTKTLSYDSCYHRSSLLSGSLQYLALFRSR